MATLTDIARGLFTKAEPDLETLRQHLRTAESTLAKARAVASAAQAAHSERVAEALGQEDADADLNRSRVEVDQATTRVQDIEEGIRTLRGKIQRAEATAAQEHAGQSWAAASELQRQRIAAFERLQDRADEFAEALAAALQVSEQAYAALPNPPAFRPLGATQGGITTMVELWLYGRTDGKLCRVGLTPHVARSRPDLAASAADLAKQLLGADPRSQKGTP